MSLGDRFWWTMDDDGTVRPCTMLECAPVMNSSDRQIADTTIGDVRISTVFLGINHQFGEGPPLLFETMVFGGEHDGDCERYSTRAEAEVGHEWTVMQITEHAESP